jgi:acyl carrier protein
VTTEDFLAIVDGECGVRLSASDLNTDFGELPGWDSLNLLKLLAALEAAMGRRLTASRVFEARRLVDVLRLTREAAQ